MRKKIKQFAYHRITAALRQIHLIKTFAFRHFFKNTHFMHKHTKTRRAEGFLILLRSQRLILII